MKYDVNKTVKVEMDNKLILTYGLTNKQMEILKNEFSDVEDVSDNFLSLIEIPSAVVVVNWDKLNDDEIEIFTEAYRNNKREFNTEIVIISNYHERDILVLHTYERDYDILNETIDVIKNRLSIPKRFNEANDRMKKTITDIEKVIKELSNNLGFEDQIRMINKGCQPYEYLTKVMRYYQELRNLDYLAKRVPYMVEVNCTLNAMMIALGVIDIEDIDFKHGPGFSLYNENELALSYITDLASMIRNHYEENLMKNHAI